MASEFNKWLDDNVLELVRVQDLYFKVSKESWIAALEWTLNNMKEIYGGIWDAFEITKKINKELESLK
jgi:hypothetical protein